MVIFKNSITFPGLGLFVFPSHIFDIMNVLWSLSWSSFWRHSSQLLSDSMDMNDERGFAAKSWWGVYTSDGPVGVAVANQWGGVECGGCESRAECDGGWGVAECGLSAGVIGTQNLAVGCSNTEEHKTWQLDVQIQKITKHGSLDAQIQRNTKHTSVDAQIQSNTKHDSWMFKYTF